MGDIYGGGNERIKVYMVGYLGKWLGMRRTV